VRRQQREERQHRDHRDVLEQQHRERALTSRGLEQALLVERLQHDRRRRQRQDHAGDECRAPFQARGDTEAAHGGGGDQHLQAAEAEDRGAQAPQPLGLELEPHHEQHHHDAELGEVHHVLALAADETEAERSDRDAGEQVAEHRAQSEPLGERHGDDGGGEVDEGLEEEAFSVHRVPRAAGSPGGRR
jgi:hypothetical protein